MLDNVLFAFDAMAIRRRRVFEHRVVGEHLRQRVGVVAIEELVEAIDQLSCAVVVARNSAAKARIFGLILNVHGSRIPV